MNLIDVKSYVHSIDPFFWQISGDIGIRWYGLSYLAGLIAAYLIMRQMVKKNLSPLTVEQVMDFMMAVAIGVMAGGRFGYVLFYNPSLLLDFSSSIPFWGALSVHEGGMSSHGGILGVIVACIYFGRKNKIPFLHLTDLCVLGGSLGFFFGRLANFINGELYGRPIRNAMNWSVKFPQEMRECLLYDPKQLPRLASAVENLSPLKIGTGSKTRVLETSQDQWMSWVESAKTTGSGKQYMYEWIQVLMSEAQAKNQAVLSELQNVLIARYPSQLIQALLEGLLVFIIINLVWLKPRRAGFVGACWGVAYASMRILGEQFRMPDANIGYELLGLTRGQWLSLGMICLAGVFFLLALRGSKDKYGGWLYGQKHVQMVADGPVKIKK